MKPGIYINLPEDDYHADPALGSTSIKGMWDDPCEFKYELDHPEVEKDTAAKTLGSAIHARILGGRKTFESEYYLKMDKEQAVKDGALDTVEDMKTWLRNNGDNVTGTKKELIQRIKTSNSEAVILQDLEDTHAMLNEGKTLLTQKQWDTVTTAAEWCQFDPMVSPFMEDGTLNLGLSEVSVFADHDVGEGHIVPVKARFDHLANHAIIDLKTFTPMLNKDAVYAIPYAVKKMRYDIQAGHYVNLWHEAKKLWEAGQIFGDYPDGYFDKVFSRDMPLWIWLFIKTTGAPQPYVRSFDPDCSALRFARQNAKEAILHYAQLVERLGLDAPWPPTNKPEALGDEELLRDR